jgi:hypothetical protein
MRKMLLTLVAALAIGSAAWLAPAGASAAPGSAALGSAVEDTSLASDVTYACWRVWRCGPYGCGYRSMCGWRPGFGYYRPFYRSYAYKPYWGYRPYWRHHHHHRGW